MFGISQGAMAKFPCLYCMAKRGVSKGGKEREWKYVNANNNRRQAPNRDAPGVDPNWDPILAIPLIRVHICVLHALVRIIEKLVYMYIKFAWIMKPTLESERTIKKIEQVLSDAGLHCGQVKIEKDLKRSGKTGNVPSKPCFGGAKARKFLSNHTQRGHLGTDFEVWRKLHAVVPDRGSSGQARVAKARAWLALDRLAPLLQKARFEDGDVEQFEAVVTEFYTSYEKAWGATNLTQYMVIT